MNKDFEKFYTMFQPDHNEWVRVRRAFIAPSITASDKGLQFLQERYRDAVQLWQGSQPPKTRTEDYYEDELFPPIPDDFPTDMPVDIPIKRKGADIVVDLTEYQGMTISLKYKDEYIKFSADEAWETLKGLIKDLKRLDR